jgi:hypothetical protein
MISPLAKKSPGVQFDPPIEAGELARLCGVTLEELYRRISCPHGAWTCRRPECSDMLDRQPVYPARLAAHIAKQFNLCLLPPKGGEPRQVKKLRADLHAIGGQCHEG